METSNFFAKTGKDESITAQSLCNQRLKLNPEIFVHLNDVYLSVFYFGCENEVKLYNGYVLKAVDGSDLEIPNTGACIEKYRIAKNHHSGVARAAVSVSYDLLNHYLLDGIIDSYRTGESSMSMRHIERAEKLTNPYHSIYIMDRNYVSISFMTFMKDRGVNTFCVA